MTSSEDVLLQVSNVRYQKKTGTLYVMNERLAWMMDNRDTVSVSTRYADIKMQKISPEGKAKIQLQAVLHDGTASTFQFTNPAGQTEQVRERDSVKDLLQQLLPKFKRKVNKELEEKNKLLTENPTLLQLYKDLVISKVITSEEFWAQHASKYTKDTATNKQPIGVSGAFLADIKPQADGCNGLKYKLTSDIIESIFKTYPAVRRKHMEYVPHKMTESEFWTKFFQSHYFHRDRIHAGNKDIFTECAKIDDQDMNKDIDAGIKDPLVDITSFGDTNLAEGFGDDVETPGTSHAGNIVHQNMIKRFNQHSFMVLKACHQSIKDDGVAENGQEEAQSSSKPVEEEDETVVKKRRIQEKLSYDDLEDSSEKITACLNLSKVERYLHGPITDPVNNSEAPAERVSLTVLRELIKALQTPLGSSHQNPAALITPAQAINAIGELTPGGSLMKGFQHEAIASMTPADIEADLKTLYLSICELLRHFWACFPPTTPQLEEKATTMHETLHRFHAAKLKPFEDRVLRECSPLSHNITSHLNQLLNSAYRKFAIWQQRKMQHFR
ncbi:general transcription factor IIH subunit 1 [Neocloeon triangulifer]|uniref:general transcription factor IIH subunit 1 n=1 Tax=Neocloeon triangulifer TaxID=2078957 RepID=UPI00286F8B55|nr:general transcription factor IIH subunit 1 [Neocloeon triangulifer]